ncbi:MAG: hypothetical protein GY821_03230 [Gammaproteobacteria bacterium]|nr:hypothetical protein [Gammaproteobacteria bacterium]
MSLNLKNKKDTELKDLRSYQLQDIALQNQQKVNTYKAKYGIDFSSVEYAKEALDILTERSRNFTISTVAKRQENVEIGLYAIDKLVETIMSRHSSVYEYNLKNCAMHLADIKQSTNQDVVGIVKSEVRQSHSIFLRMFFENIQPVTRHYGAPWGAY